MYISDDRCEDETFSSQQNKHSADLPIRSTVLGIMALLALSIIAQRSFSGRLRASANHVLGLSRGAPLENRDLRHRTLFLPVLAGRAREDPHPY